MTICVMLTADEQRISIHIPRVGDDNEVADALQAAFAISIHIPRVGDDESCASGFAANAYFNPHPPCGG